MAEILDIEEYIDNLMYRGITTEELISRITQNLHRIEDLFLTSNRCSTRNMIRACIAYSRMLFEHERLMFSAREYLLRRIKALKIREKDLNFEISILRAAASSGENSAKKSEDASYDLSCALNNKNSNKTQSLDQSNITTINLDRETILCEINKSEHNLSNLSEEIAYKKKLLLDIDMRIEDASNFMHCQDPQNSNERESPSSSEIEPAYTEGSARVGQIRSDTAFRRRGWVPQTQTRLCSMNMSNIDKISEEFGTSGRLDDVVPGVVRSSSYERYSHMGTACVRMLQLLLIMKKLSN